MLSELDARPCKLKTKKQEAQDLVDSAALTEFEIGA